MDKKEWDRVEQTLRLGGHVRLNCDGYEVEIGLVRISMCRLALCVLWVNGVFKGKWFLEDCEERRRFLYPKKSYVYSRKFRASMKKKARFFKIMGLKYDFDASRMHWNCAFPNVAALRRHFEAHNESIEVLSPCVSEELASA